MFVKLFTALDGNVVNTNHSTCHVARTTPEEALAAFHSAGTYAEALPLLSFIHTKRLKYPHTFLCAEFKYSKDYVPIRRRGSMNLQRRANDCSCEELPGLRNSRSGEHASGEGGISSPSARPYSIARQ